ncbi:50S ribosomal protein L25/general stress protein Ctc [Bacillus sp. FSL W7-1360]
MTTLHARMRQDLRGQKAKHVRKEGLVPGVVYGKKIESQNVAVDHTDLKKLLREIGQNGLLKLDVENDQSYQVMIQAVQKDPLKNDYLHIDFFEVDMLNEIQAQVPVHIEGDSPGVSQGGLLNHQLHELTVRCLPADIPASITVDISQLQIGDVLHVAHVRPNVAVHIINEDEDTVVAVQPPAVETAEPKETEEGDQEAETSADAS